MYQKILLPIDVDAQETWSDAVDAAILLAQAGGGEIHLVTVQPDFGMSVVGSYFPAGYEKKVEEEIAGKLQTLAKEHFPGDLAIHTHVTHGKIYEQIIATADKLGCDVIVMASHRPALKDYLLGPNAARVVRHAKQSVFVVR